MVLLNRYGVRADYVRADLSKLADIDALWSTVTTLYPEGVDILINNAGNVSVINYCNNDKILTQAREE